MVLLEVENKTFYIRNEFFSKQKKIKKTHVWIKWLFNISNINVLQFFKIIIYTKKIIYPKMKFVWEKLNCTYNVVTNINNSNIMHEFEK